MKDNLIKDKSFAFALRTVKLYKYLAFEQKEFILSKQILKSGTSVGANVEEACSAQSKKEFIAKLNISLKEGKETHYWLRLLHFGEYIDKKMFDSMIADCDEIISILTAIIKSTNKNLECKI